MRAYFEYRLNDWSDCDKRAIFEKVLGRTSRCTYARVRVNGMRAHFLYRLNHWSDHHKSCIIGKAFESIGDRATFWRRLSFFFVVKFWMGLQKTEQEITSNSIESSTGAEGHSRSGRRILVSYAQV